MAKKKLVLTDDVKHLLIHSVPDGLVSPSGNRVLTLIQDLVDQVNEANGLNVVPTTTAAPTTTVATTTAAPTTTTA